MFVAKKASKLVEPKWFEGVVGYRSNQLERDGKCVEGRAVLPPARVCVSVYCVYCGYRWKRKPQRAVASQRRCGKTSPVSFLELFAPTELFFWFARRVVLDHPLVFVVLAGASCYLHAQDLALHG